jgi:hypothetical protein
MSIANSSVWTKTEYTVEAYQVADIIFGNNPWLICHSCRRALFCITSKQQSTCGDDTGAIAYNVDNHNMARSTMKFVYNSNRLYTIRSYTDKLVFWAPIPPPSSSSAAAAAAETEEEQEHEWTRSSLCETCVGTRDPTSFGWRGINNLMTEEMLVKFLLDKKLVCDICNCLLVKLSKLDHTITRYDVYWRIMGKKTPTK